MECILCSKGNCEFILSKGLPSDCFKQRKICNVAMNSKEMIYRKDTEGFSKRDNGHSHPLSPEFIRKKLKKQMDKYPALTMSHDTLERIFKKLPDHLYKNWNTTCDMLLVELKKEYEKSTSDILLGVTLYDTEGMTPKKKEPCLDCMEKPFTPKIALEKKALLDGNILYYYPFIRHLIAEAQKLLPLVFLDCSKYSGFKGFYHPEILLSMMEKEIDREDLRMEFDWFGKLFMHVSSKDFFLNWNKCKVSRFINLIIQVTKTIALDRIHDTLWALVKFFTNSKTTPKIAVQVYHSFDGRIVIIPTAADVYGCYCNLIRRVYDMGKNFEHFEMFHITKGRRGCISLEKYDSVKNTYENEVKDFVNGIYQQMTDYYKELSEKYIELISGSETSYEKLSTLTIEELIRMADHYISIKGQINEIESNTYFPHFRANNKAMIKALLFIVDSRTDQIMNEVLKFHVEYCERNCEEFCKISEKAVKVPETTEELISLAKFMKYVSTEHMANARDGILSYLVHFYRVMEIVTVPQNYLDMMGLMLGWLTYMESVIKQNSSMLEISKNEFEERLNHVTEKLNEDLENFSSEELDGLDHLDDYSMIINYTLHIMKCLRKVQHFDETAKWINKEESLFEMTLSTYPELDEIKAFVNPFAKLIFQLYKWNMVYQTIMNGSLENVTLESVESTLDEYNDLIEQLQKWFKSKIKQQASENNPRRFKGNVDDSEYDNWPAPMKLLHGAQKNLNEIKDHKNFIKLLCNPRMTGKHWEIVSSIAGRDMTPYKGSSLRQFINFKVEDKMEQFEKISERATKEYHLKENLIQMKEEWTNVHFVIQKSNRAPLTVLDSVDHIQSVIDNQLVKTLSIRSSSFVKPIEDDLKIWYHKLGLINTIIEEWCRVQIQWLYFMPIFSCDVISEQMKNEGILFKEVDETYLGLMQLVQKNTLVLSVTTDENVLPSLKMCLKKFEQINAGVKKYLEKKRLFFPRFFFLSDEQMLQFLSESKDPRKAQVYLKKCFTGICYLGLDQLLNIESLISSEFEEIRLVNKVSTIEARGSVEKWLVQVEDQMVISMREIIKHALDDFKCQTHQEWYQAWPGQVVLCISDLCWTRSIHEYFHDKQTSALESYYKEQVEEINEIIMRLKKNLPASRRITLTSMVILNVHKKDVTWNLYKNNTDSPSDFLWLSQLKYYWADEIQVHLLNARLDYSCEYLGNGQRLVVTPLTERCYRTLVGACNIHYCGAPEGPTSTGKTETIKDLAAALAVYCHLFNCSFGTDISTFDKFLKGIASSGAWICFHELDRVETETLSIAAQKMMLIVQALRQDMATFPFDGTSLILKPSCFICITINPGYTGRFELPSNMKALFRPVAMMIPDFTKIAEVYLLSNGLAKPKILGMKLVSFFKLVSLRIPQHTHFDFGLRAMKSVMKSTAALNIEYPQQQCEELLMKSIIIIALPKIPVNHQDVFFDILKDIFPSALVELPLVNNFSDVVLEICEQNYLEFSDKFRHKVNQANELMLTNHSVMLIGDPFSGKSTLLKVLREVRQLLGNKADSELEILMNVINPKAVPLDYLYGSFNDAYEWNDGVIGQTFRELTGISHNWIVFDGPVDSTWVENLNTALDQKRILCLNNGEVIEIMPFTSIIFESTDLLEVSPSTVSRCGLVYFESDTIGWQGIMKYWNKRLPNAWKEDKEDRFLLLLNWLIPLCTQFISAHCNKKIDFNIEHSVRCICQLIEIMLTEAMEGQDMKYINAWAQAVVMQSVNWVMTGNLEKKCKEKFDAYYRMLWRTNEENNRPRDFSEEIEIVLPNEGLIEDYSFIYKAKGLWKHWPEVLKTMKYDDVYNPKTCLVSTVDSLKFTAILELFIKHEKPFLLTGQNGTGKTSLIRNLLLSFQSENFTPSFLSFTTFSSVSFTQELILSKLIKKKKSIYGPSGNRKCIMFIDDINMLQTENNSQPSLELIRQFFDHKYWYSKKNLQKIYLHDLVFVAAMTLQKEKKQLLPLRFLSHFTLFSIQPFSDENLTKIFTTVVFLGLRKNGFPADVIALAQQVVSATLNIYNSIRNNLLPIPRKCHYIFSIRDLVRVFQGFLLIRKESSDGKKGFIRLWVHEVLRVFYDRLIDLSDKDWLFKELRRVIEEQYKEEFDSVLDGLGQSEDTMVTESRLANLIFTSAFDSEAVENKKYEEIVSLDSFENLASKMLEEFNSKSTNPLNIILFRYALEHLARISRILTMPQGNGVLIGVNGTGRQSLVKLAAFMLHQSIYQPDALLSFEVSNWKNDIKKILKCSGAENHQCVLLLNDSQLQVNCIMQDVNSFLNTGEIPNLFAVSEMQDIAEMVRMSAQVNWDSENNTFSIFEHFIHCCKKNLHIVLCMSSDPSGFRSSLRTFPSIINYCTLDWFEVEWTLNANGRQLKSTGWPENALERVAKVHLAEVDLEETVKMDIINICKYLHVSARDLSKKFYEETGRKTIISSDSYIDLLELYKYWVKKKKSELELSISRYLGGLKKLEFAACQVEIMQTDLESLQPALKIAAEEMSEMLKVIETETFEVEKASERVRLDEEIANEQAMGAMELKTECENDLALAIPILEDAVAALNTLKPADITLVKSMKNPPETVKLVLAAVCVMKGIKPDRLPDPKNPGRRINDYWGPSKRLLGDMTFLQQLKDYDKDNIPPSIMKAVRSQYLNHKDFKPKAVAKASSAAEGLCKWVIALDKYDVVVKEVAPKKEKLRTAEKEYSETLGILEEKRNLLKGLEDKLAELKENLKEANERKIRLQNEVVSCSKKLQKAQRIIGSLGGEKERWENIAEDLKKQFNEIPGNILLSCSIIAYLAPLSPEYRKNIVNDWSRFIVDMEIPLSMEFSMPRALSSSVQTEQWAIYGLANDPFSVENAVIMNSSKKWPVLLDPQNQAKKWIKNMEKHNDLKVIRPSEKYIDTINFCVQSGKPLLLENSQRKFVTFLESALKKYLPSHGHMEYTLDGASRQVHKDFRFYITTNLVDLECPSDLYKKVIIINFTLTMDGLAEQLLEIVVDKERPELQEKRNTLLLESSKNKKDLQAVEDGILKTLSSVVGNILEDENAVNSLDSSKAVSVEIKLKETETKMTRDDIEEFRLVYKSVSSHCATLYSTVTNLSSLDPMYQYSLKWFLKIFIMSIGVTLKSNTTEERIHNLKETFNYSLYSHISFTLFKKDKVLYSFILCQTLLTMKNKLEISEINLLCSIQKNLSKKHYLGKPRPEDNPGKEWLPENKWNEICRISSNSTCLNFQQNLTENLKLWRDVYLTPKLNSDDIPINWYRNLTSFQKIIILSILRPDRLLSEIYLFIKNEIGEKFVLPPPSDMATAFEESDSRTPLIVISSPGNDPMQAMFSLAKKKNKLRNFTSLSFQKNQALVTQRTIEEARKNGMWLSVQNCHLSMTWIPFLENIMESQSTTEDSPDFRLWLTTNSSPNFPLNLLQNGVKIINEEPIGLKEIMNLRYHSEPICDLGFYESCPGKESLFTRLLYSITFFHAVVCERKRFGSIGWTTPYSFDVHDYVTSVFQLQIFLCDSEETSLETLLFLIGECNYGGKVTDEWDKRTLHILLQQFINTRLVNTEEYSLIDGNDLYNLPIRYDYKDFIACIENLPADNNPDIQGLHTNAGFAHDLGESSLLIDGLCLIYGNLAKNEDKNKNLEYIMENTKSKIPELFDLEESEVKILKNGGTYMNKLLKYELAKFNDIITVLNETINNALRALKGFTVLTSELEAVSISLLENEIPKVWTQITHSGQNSLGSYISDLRERRLFLQEWLISESLNDYWLPALYYPQAFLTNIIQDYSCKNNIFVDDIRLSCKLLDSDRAVSSPDSGVNVYGIFLRGARWNRSEYHLDEQYHMVLHDKLPALNIKPSIMKDHNNEGEYLCPLYITLARNGQLSTLGLSNNYITALFLPCKGPSDHWVKRGVAMSCQTVD